MMRTFNTYEIQRFIMKRIIISCLLLLSVAFCYGQTVTWFSSTAAQTWQQYPKLPLLLPASDADVEINKDKTLQTIEGFGTCFNEVGWTSLSMLPAADREAIFKELFAPGVGAGFTICRMPLGANDFSRDWYSYNETAGDFEMNHFSISNDMETLVPFIKKAQQYNPGLKIWASPWSPPSWMKYNKHYAARSLQKGITNIKSDEWGIDFTGLDNGLLPAKEGKEGTNMFIQEPAYFKAYALYFNRFIKAYRQEKINISMVMPQNEFNSAQPFPSCTWTANGLAEFISYLGPEMNNIGVKVFFGTMERPNAKLVDTILTDPRSKSFIDGVGFQWAGKEAIPFVHKNYPGLTLFQSEQECGNGKNDWKFASYTWTLMKHYFNNGAGAYMYWNTSLKDSSISRWGWKQNSLISVNPATKTYHYNYDYYILKHLSHFVKPGAKLLATSGSFNNLLAFVNPDKSMVIVLQNDQPTANTINIRIGDQMLSLTPVPGSVNTLLLPATN
jgi:glucosylceramidase